MPLNGFGGVRALGKQLHSGDCLPFGEVFRDIFRGFAVDQFFRYMESSRALLAANTATEGKVGRKYNNGFDMYLCRLGGSCMWSGIPSASVSAILFGRDGFRPLPLCCSPSF